MRITLGLAISFAAACGSNAPSIAYSDLDDALQKARCEQLVRCHEFPDQASCTSFSRVLPNTSIAAAISAGKIHYDGAQAQDCVTQTSQLSCDTTAHDAHVTPAACDQMFAGTVAGGTSCSLDEECASGTCDLPASCPDFGCCVGSCRPTQAAAGPGGSCARITDCKSGLVCGGDDTCHTPGAMGATCAIDRECTDNLACVGGSASTAGTCQPLPKLGEACPFFRCADANLRCDSTTTRCVAFGLPGDPCPTGSECGFNFECNTTTMLCEPFPTLGMACDGNCQGESYCAIREGATTGTCSALLANNAACDGDQQCQSSDCQDGAAFSSCIDKYVCY
jgi:hypothetical protein